VKPQDLPGDISLSAKQARQLARKGYLVFDCICTMHHTVEIPMKPQLVSPVQRVIHSNGGE
jgi:hypothetical protein